MQAFEVQTFIWVSLWHINFLQKFGSTCWDWYDGIRSHISRARAELAEDKNPSFGQQDEPLTVTVLRQKVAMVEAFVYLVYLGSMIQSTTQKSKLSWFLIPCAAMQNLDNQIWKSRISISTKLKLHNTCNRAFYLSSCTALSAGQLPRQMYSRLMLSINGVCESC